MKIRNYSAPQLCDERGKRVPQHELIFLVFSGGMIAHDKNGQMFYWKIDKWEGRLLLMDALPLEGMANPSLQQWRTVVELFAAGAGRDLIEVDISAQGYTNYALPPRSRGQAKRSRSSRQVITMAGDVVEAHGPTIVSTAELRRIGTGSARVAALETQRVPIHPDSILAHALRDGLRCQDGGTLEAELAEEAESLTDS